MRTLLLCLCMVMGSHAAMAKSSIYRMMTGGRILELAQTRQLTNPDDGEVSSAAISPDGKYVVYMRVPEVGPQACIMKTSLGRPIVAMSPPRNWKEEGFVGEVWYPVGRWSWSPDSRLIAFMAAYAPRGKGPEDRIAVLDYSGKFQTSFPLQDRMRFPWSLTWSPDSRKFTGLFRAGQSEPQMNLLVFDVQAGSTQTLASGETGALDFDSWNEAGSSLDYWVRAPGQETEAKPKAQLRQVNLSTLEDKVINEDYHPVWMPSPDGAFGASPGGPVVDIRNRQTGMDIRIGPGTALGWAPNSDILAYQKPIVIEDQSKKRKQEFSALWLAAAEVNPFNHMCAALDSKKDQPPTWSDDCLKMAYVSDGKVYLAQFAWKPITPYDKLDAGLPLTEQEEQSVLMDSARAIGEAIGMYHADWDGVYPPGEDFVQELIPYARYKTLFFRPGTQTVAFQYFRPAAGLANPAATVMGVFDVGYQWKVILYADGHVQIVPK